jgi:putative phosphoesterase
MITIGVIADTHIPDRVRALHPGILPLFQAAGVAHILHAGDISTSQVLDTLRQVAPVTAVRGNRDFLAGQLNMVELLEIGGVPIALMHGHGGLLPYLFDKWKFWRYGYQFKRYINLLVRASEDAKVVVYGHTHHIEMVTVQNKLLFNPGSASFGFGRGKPPSIGLLHITPTGEILPEVRMLEGYRIVKHQWVEKNHL